MKATIIKQVGTEKIMLEGEGKSYKDALFNAVFNASFFNVHKCGICGSSNLTLGARKAQDKYSYVFVKCTSCKAEVNFSERQNDGVTYLASKDGVLDWKKKED